MLIVETRDLRNALAAVLPHADIEPESPRWRVRVAIGEVNVVVTATDLYSVALAIVSVHDVHQEMVGLVVDLAPDEVKKILAVHKPRRSATKELEEEHTLGVTVEDGTVTTRDVSGLFPGEEALSVPHLPFEDRFPDVEGYLGQQVLKHETFGVAYGGGPLCVFPPRLAAFHAASKAYGEPLAIRVTGSRESARHPLLIGCGDSFLGQLATEAPDRDRDQHAEVLDAWDGWRSRLPESPRRPWDLDVDPGTSSEDEHDDDATEATTDEAAADLRRSIYDAGVVVEFRKEPTS